MCCYVEIQGHRNVFGQGFCHCYRVYECRWVWISMISIHKGKEKIENIHLDPMNSSSWYCALRTVATWKRAPCYASDNEGIKRRLCLPKNEWSNISLRQANDKAFWSRRFFDVHTLWSVFGCESSLPWVQIRRFFHLFSPQLPVVLRIFYCFFVLFFAVWSCFPRGCLHGNIFKRKWQPIAFWL